MGTATTESAPSEPSELELAPKAYWLRQMPLLHADWEPGCMLLRGPTMYSSTAEWRAFRRGLDGLEARMPEQAAFWNRWRVVVDKTLEWRETVPPEGRFWQADEVWRAKHPMMIG